MVGIIGGWNIPPDKRFVVEYTYRVGENKFKTLHNKLVSFGDNRLVERIHSSPLGHMYKAMMYFRFSCFLPYQMLSRSIYTNKKELLIRLGDTTCRLGRMDFALISGLSFKEVEPDTRSIHEKEHTTLLARTDPKTGLIDPTNAPFLKPLKEITIKMIEDELKNASDPELTFKIGLIYLIESVMHGKKHTSSVSPFVFRLVEDINRFLSYPWGTYFWDLSMEEWNAKIKLMQKPQNGKDSNRPEIYSLVPILFVWAYETLLGEGVSYMKPNELHVVQENSIQIPHILRWRPCKGRLHNNKLSELLNKEGLGVNRYLKPNEDEVRMLRDNGLMDDEISNPPCVYPTPVLSAIPHDPVVALFSQVNVDAKTQTTNAHAVDVTTHTGTSYQASLTASQAYDLESRYIIEDMRVEMRNSLTVTMEKARADRNELRRQIGVLREQFEAFKEATRRELFAIREEVTEHNRDILNLMRAAYNRDGVAMGSDGRFVDLQPPPDTECESVYRGKIHPAHQTHLHRQVQMQQGNPLTVVNEAKRGVEVSQVKPDNLQASERKNTGWVKEGTEEPYNDFNVVVNDEEETSLSVGVVGRERNGKRQHEMDETVESSVAKRVRVESKCSLEERICKLKKWLSSSNPSPIPIPMKALSFGSVGKVIAGPSFFEEILSPEESIGKVHVDCYMELLMRRMLGYPEAFKVGSILLEQNFGDDMTKDLIPHSKFHAPVWKEDTTAYTLWEIESGYWVAVVISVKERTISVYDSFDEKDNIEAINKHLDAWANYMQSAVESSLAIQDLEEMDSKAPFKIVFLNEYKRPQMRRSEDCIVYAIKYIEELSTGGNSKRVYTKNINDLREEICADLYCQYMGV